MTQFRLSLYYFELRICSLQSAGDNESVVMNKRSAALKRPLLYWDRRCSLSKAEKSTVVEYQYHLGISSRVSTKKLWTRGPPKLHLKMATKLGNT